MWFLLLSILALAEQQIPFAQAGKVVDLGYAIYQSDLSIVPGVTSFLGIRYAAPPTGILFAISSLISVDSSKASYDGEHLKHPQR
jgi:hypothetical protein